MKKWLMVLIAAVSVLLMGCSSSQSQMDRALALRAKLVSGSGYSFDASVTADYGDKLHQFKMHCQADSLGNLKFEVTEPESISGITGTVSEAGGKLTFDDQAVAFELLADGQVTPVSAPWILVHTLHFGCITSCSVSGDGLLLDIDDRYEEDALNLSVQLDNKDIPVAGEILWKGRKILSLTVANFVYR